MTQSTRQLLKIPSVPLVGCLCFESGTPNIKSSREAQNENVEKMFWKFQGLSHGLRRGGRRLIGATCFVAGFRYMFYKHDEDKIFVLEYCKLKQTKYSEWAWDAG
eukprot:108871_1